MLLLAGVPEVPSLQEVQKILEEVQGHETGWPPWWVPTRDPITPYVRDGCIECWLADTHFADAAHSDFWRASPDGMMFLLRGYEEDAGDSHHEPGTALDPVTAVWRLGECLLHAGRLSRRLSDTPVEVLFRAQWRGLKGREIRWIAGRAFSDSGRGRVSKQDVVDAEVSVVSDAIEDSLPELVGGLVSRLCEPFHFYVLPQRIVEQQLAQMRGGR